MNKYYTYQYPLDKGWWSSTLPRYLSWDAGRWQTPEAEEAFPPVPEGSGKAPETHLENEHFLHFEHTLLCGTYKRDVFKTEVLNFHSIQVPK